MHSPKEAHLEAVYRILRYLTGSLDKGLFLMKKEARIGLHWAGSIEDR